MDSPLLIPASTTIEIQEEPETATTTAPTPNSSPPFFTRQILYRLAIVLAIGAACIVTKQLAVNSFEVSVINAAADTPIGRRFQLKFVSNGEISRILYRSNKIIEQVLYPTSSFPRKPINHITIQLSNQTLTDMVSVHNGIKAGEFLVILGPDFLSSSNPAIALRTVLHRAMACVRVWDGPEEVVSAMVQYLEMQATSETIDTVDVDSRLDGSCWSGGFLRYCESREKGFMARLNWQLTERSGLGLLNRSMCKAFKASLTAQQMAPTQSTSD
ncbi:Plant basic secretory protein (BSP) family protein [Rhynchospora pubera]|uniref:Plant basic secretory protein (BSP) family protein n=1 Tax=Rhynchospora pubera TaxID=906938 RepID=A0AAV8FBX6_9POAL|nr:Plant basic secretory protein (BSP) family protein [Rhynchospora pubera]